MNPHWVLAATGEEAGADGFRRTAGRRQDRGGVMKTSIQSNLAEAWLTATRSGEWEDAEAFANLLLSQCKQSMPPLVGIMAGEESEVIQNACLMLLGAFLVRNQRLGEAAIFQDVREIERHLRVSIRTCLSFAIRRFARSRSLDLSRRVDFDEALLGSVIHPWLRREADLGLEERCAIALAALHVALRGKILSRTAAKVFLLTLENGLSGREVAARMGISPSAVSQQLRRITAQLNLVKDVIEVEPQ